MLKLENAVIKPAIYSLSDWYKISGRSCDDPCGPFGVGEWTGVPCGDPPVEQPNWKLEVGYTPTLGQFGHLFIELFEDGSEPGEVGFSFVLDGGPQHSCRLIVAQCGNLEAAVSTSGLYNEILNPYALAFFSLEISPGTAAGALGYGYSLVAALNASNTTYDPVNGPNSNSVVYTLLTDLKINVPITMGAIQSGPTTVPVGILNVNGSNEYFTGWGQLVP